MWKIEGVGSYSSVFVSFSRHSSVIEHNYKSKLARKGFWTFSFYNNRRVLERIHGSSDSLDRRLLVKLLILPKLDHDPPSEYLKLSLLIASLPAAEFLSTTSVGFWAVLPIHKTSKRCPMKAPTSMSWESTTLEDSNCSLPSLRKEKRADKPERQRI